MLQKIYKKLKTSYPQNFIVKHPLYGSAFYMVFSFIFMITYRPLKTHESYNFSYAATMAIYMLASAAGAFIFINILKLIPFFSVKKQEWTFMKEILSDLLILAGTGISLYFMGFLMEEPSNRWNIATFLNSCAISFLIGIVPFGFFTLINYRHLIYNELSTEYQPDERKAGKEERIHINSRLKKEELSFFPDELIYAESEGNYVAFYLADEKRIRKELIRNSMNEVEQQLSSIDCFARIHRAFIVNIRKVSSKKGNTLGYRLKLYGSDQEIPVSRQNVQSFDQMLNQLR